MKLASPETIHAARALLAQLAVERPELIPQLSSLIEQMHPCRHSQGFAGLVWFGTYYSFTKKQALIVAKLWEAWENGSPDVWQEDLLRAAGTFHVRLADVFKGSPAWGSLIVSVNKGSYRLAEPKS